MGKIIFITIEKLLEMQANNEKFKLVEVLPEDSYKDGHIPGAINIPLDKLEFLADKYLERMESIVVYCGSYSCQASTKATRKLLEMGYKHVLDFKAGKRWWQHAGLGLEK